MVLLTDEIRTYCIFNYANINWTSSTSAGNFNGRGGRQSALVGLESLLPKMTQNAVQPQILFYGITHIQILKNTVKI